MNIIFRQQFVEVARAQQVALCHRQFGVVMVAAVVMASKHILRLFAAIQPHQPPGQMIMHRGFGSGRQHQRRKRQSAIPRPVEQPHPGFAPHAAFFTWLLIFLWQPCLII